MPKISEFYGIVISMKQSNEVKACRLLDGYKVQVTFEDGFSGVVNFEKHVRQARGPMLKPLQALDVFRQVRVDLELGTIVWPNGYDVCPDTLRYWCEIGRVCSQEELDRAFAAPEAMMLHDKPGHQPGK